MSEPEEGGRLCFSLWWFSYLLTKLFFICSYMAWSFISVIIFGAIVVVVVVVVIVVVVFKYAARKSYDAVLLSWIALWALDGVIEADSFVDVRDATKRTRMPAMS